MPWIPLDTYTCRACGQAVVGEFTHMPASFTWRCAYMVLFCSSAVAGAIPWPPEWERAQPAEGVTS